MERLNESLADWIVPEAWRMPRVETEVWLLFQGEIEAWLLLQGETEVWLLFQGETEACQVAQSTSGESHPVGPAVSQPSPGYQTDGYIDSLEGFAFLR